MNNRWNLTPTPALLTLALLAAGPSLLAQPLVLDPPAAVTTYGAEPLRFRLGGAGVTDASGLLWTLVDPAGADAALARDPDGGGAAFRAPFVLEPTEYRVVVSDPRDEPARIGEATVTVHPHPLFRKGNDAGKILEAYLPSWRLPRLELLAGGGDRAKEWVRMRDGQGDQARFDGIRVMAWMPAHSDPRLSERWLVADSGGALRAVSAEGAVATVTEGREWHMVGAMAVLPPGPERKDPTLTLTRGQSRTQIEALGAGDQLLPYAGAETAGCRIEVPKEEALFGCIQDTASDAAGNLYLVDRVNRMILRIDRDSGRVTTLAGSPESDGAQDSFRAGAAPAGLGSLGMPVALALDPATGDAIFFDHMYLRLATPDGAVCSLKALPMGTAPSTSPAGGRCGGGEPITSHCVTLAVRADWIYLFGDAGLRRIHLRTGLQELLVPAGETTRCGPLAGTPGVGPDAGATIRPQGKIAVAPTGEILIANHERLYRLVLGPEQ